MKKILMIVFSLLLTTAAFAWDGGASDYMRHGFFLGASYSALMCNSPIDDGFNANYNGGGLKLGYILSNGMGLVFSGDFQENDRATFGAKAGVLFTLGRNVQIYPMIGYYIGQPVWNHFFEKGEALYIGSGIDFTLQQSMGFFLEAGLARWDKTFTYDGTTTYVLPEGFNSLVLAIGVSYSTH